MCFRANTASKHEQQTEKGRCCKFTATPGRGQRPADLLGGLGQGTGFMLLNFLLLLCSPLGSPQRSFISEEDTKTLQQEVSRKKRGAPTAETSQPAKELNP